MPDFKSLDEQVETVDVKAERLNTTDVKNKGSKTNTEPYKAGVITQASATLMIPQAIRSKLTHISQVYSLPFDMGTMSLQDITPEKVKAFGEIVRMYTRNSKLLPEILKLSKQMLNADVTMAQYHSKITSASIKHQEGIDKATAEIFYNCAKASIKASKLEIKTNKLTEAKTARFGAWKKLNEESIFADELDVIDAELVQRTSIHKSLTASKKAKIEFNGKNRKDDIDYQNATFVESEATQDAPKKKGKKKAE